MNRRGFMLLELVLALGLSSVIMFGFMQINRAINQFIDKSRESFVADRKVCLLFNQLERDITSASIPVIAPKHDEKAEGKKQQPDEAKKEDKKQEAPQEPKPEEKKGDKKEEKKLHPFVADIFDGASIKRKDKKLELLHSMSMITLNSLEMYNDQSPRLLRVFYELKENKNRPFKDKKSYLLYRKQTTDLYNVKAKEPEEKDKPDKKDKIIPVVKTYLVADNIEFLSLEFHRTRNLPKDEKDKEKQKEQKPLAGFAWGSKEETENILPEYILVTISLWAENYKSTTQYECMMPLFSYNAPALPKKKEEKKKEPKEGEGAEPLQQLSSHPQHQAFIEKATQIAGRIAQAMTKNKPVSFPLLEPGYLMASGIQHKEGHNEKL